MCDVYENMELVHEFDAIELEEKENDHARWESILAKLGITKKAIKMPTWESILAEEEEERKILRKIQDAVAEKMKPTDGKFSSARPTAEEKAEADARSVYVGNVDYSVKSAELEALFLRCGPIRRVTIPCDKCSGHAKGFAYVEFSDKEGAQKSLSMTGSFLKGRQIKVNEKRTNKPGLSTTNKNHLGSGGVHENGPAPVDFKFIYVGNRPRSNRTVRR